MIFLFIALIILIFTIIVQIYMKTRIKDVPIVFGIVSNNRTKENFVHSKNPANKVLIRIDEDDVSFLYRPKSRFYNVSFGMAVDFYRVIKDNGTVKYIGVSGYYHNLLYLYGLSFFMVLLSFI